MLKIIKKIFEQLKNHAVLIVICTIITLVSAFVPVYFDGEGTSGTDSPIYILESNIFDYKVQNAGINTSPTKVGVLAIDEESIKQFGRWPFSRQVFAKAFTNLKKLGVKWIGFDVVFSEKQETLLKEAIPDLHLINGKNYQKQVASIIAMEKESPADKKLISSIENYENIITAYFFYQSKKEAKLNLGNRDFLSNLDLIANSEIGSVILPDEYTLENYKRLNKGVGIVTNIGEILNVSNHFAFINNDLDDDAVSRWVTLVAKIGDHLMPSLALKTAAAYLNREIIVFFDSNGVESIGLLDEDTEELLEIPIDTRGYGRVLMKPRGPSRSFQHFSLAKAYNNSFSKNEKKQLKDGILLLGATATALADIRPNAFDSAIDGVENHAAVIDNILNEDFFRRDKGFRALEFKVILIIGLILSPIMIWGNSIVSILGLVTAMVSYYYIDKYFWFSKGMWVYYGIPNLEMIALFVSTNLYKFFLEENDKKFIKQAFGNYISPEVIEQMHKSGEPPKLGGESGIRTAYFTDIQGFSSFSEQLSATRLVELLNEYLTVMTDILLDCGGTLDKYEGDAIIAFFGAPMPQADHATRACHVALKMQEALDQLRKKWVSEGDKWPDIVKNMRMRIGVNSGEIVTGNMGSQNRMNYTMMGDAVNLAARLEESAKQYGVFTQVSDNTIALTDNRFLIRELDTIRVVGRQEPVTTYELLGFKGESSDVILKLKDSFDRALATYKDQRWEEALAMFKESVEWEYRRIPELKGVKKNPSEIYMERCQQFIADPPPDNWDGVFVLKSK